MQRYKAIIEYDGSNYHGMQKQKNASLPTIQAALEGAISQFANTKIEIDYSGRTDTGVHALGQIIHFDLDCERTEKQVLRGINFYLIKSGIFDIVIKKVENVTDNFHARFSAKSRLYLYRVLNSEVASPLLANRVFFYPYKLDIDKMRTAAALLVSKKMDFASFCSAESVENVNTMKTIMSIEIWRECEQVVFKYEAKSFLHNMIRIMTGVLLEVGRGRLKPDDVLTILAAKKRPDKCETAPSCGLYFLETKY